MSFFGERNMESTANNTKLNNSGFSLVEVLVAIVILAIVSLPILSTFTNAAKMNGKARRVENANTAINNIVEEAKVMTLDELASGAGEYTYQLSDATTNTYLVGNKKDSNENLYLEGVNKEKFYVKAEFDPSAYTNNATGSTKDSNPSNNINSAGMSVYTDISSGEKFVYRDDNIDNQAEAHFEYYVGGTYDRKYITKTTTVNVAITKNDADSVAGVKLVLDQKVSVTVSYHYGSTSGIAYPDYEKTTTMRTNKFTAEKTKETRDGTEVDVYNISGDIEDNVKSLYVFYIPFDDFADQTPTVTNDIYAKDKIAINYSYPSAAELGVGYVNYENLNVYMIQQDKYVNNGTAQYKMVVRPENLSASFNGLAVGTDTTKFNLYSNVVKSKIRENKDAMFRLTVTVWWNDPTMSDESKKVATMTTTKVN